MGSDFKHRRRLKIEGAESVAVDMTTEHGALVGKPPKRMRRRYTFEQLIGGITEQNRHDEIAWAPPVGNEVW
jgi:antitoxin component of MazEF toxin-antitoxin module